MVRKALGRGLDAILPQAAEPEERTPVRTGLEVSITLIDSNPEQPRTRMNEKTLRELAQSIKQNGLIQPLVVKQAGERYQLIAGERRLRASELAGLTTIPVVIKDVSDDDVLVLALIENIQREDLNPLEEAQAYDTLMKQQELTQEELSNAVGKERSTIANMLRLLKLPKYALEGLADGKLTGGHARAILMLEDSPDAMKTLYNLIIQKGISVRNAEEQARAKKETKKTIAKEKPEKYTDPFLKDAERKLCNKLSAKVSINQKSNGKGQITINFASLDDLQRLFETLLLIKY